MMEHGLRLQVCSHYYSSILSRGAGEADSAGKEVKFDVSFGLATIWKFEKDVAGFIS